MTSLKAITTMISAAAPQNGRHETPDRSMEHQPAVARQGTSDMTPLRKITENPPEKEDKRGGCEISPISPAPFSKNFLNFFQLAQSLSSPRDKTALLAPRQPLTSTNNGTVVVNLMYHMILLVSSFVATRYRKWKLLSEAIHHQL